MTALPGRLRVPHVTDGDFTVHAGVTAFQGVSTNRTEAQSYSLRAVRFSEN